MTPRTLLLPLLLTGCFEDSATYGDGSGTGTWTGSGESNGMSQEGCQDRTRTCAEIRAAFADGAGDFELDCDEDAGLFTVYSSGVPLYDSNQTTPNGIADQGWQVTWSLTATCADGVEDVTSSRGEIGMTVNGIPFYGPEDGQGRDAIVYEGPTLDDCNGHSDNRCSYHHHNEPVCVFGTSTDIMDRAGDDGHPPVVAFAADGFPVHGVDPDDPDGAELDDCNGHQDADRGYHYHMTDDYPYTIGCLAGQDRFTAISSGAADGECDNSGGPPQ
ncbi:MAG: YHYH protein [Alphaproteobacteria bacterium]|nr:YHYH protein [Alphaproteobacteria bacterium]